MPKNFREQIKSKKIVIIGLAVLLIIFLFFFIKNWLIVATVNGKIISRFEVINALEKQSGKKTLDSIITSTLIIQEAQKRNINVTQTDIDNELKKIESNLTSQGTTLDQALQTQGMTRENLTEQIKLQLLLQKMVGGNITVSDKEIQDYINKNKDQIPPSIKADTLKQQVSQQIKQQKTQQKMQDFVQQLRQKAKINYFINY